MKKQPKPPGKSQETTDEYNRFEFLTRNLISVSNAEVREIIKDEKKKKKTTKRESS